MELRVEAPVDKQGQFCDGTSAPCWEPGEDSGSEVSKSSFIFVLPDPVPDPGDLNL